MHMCEVLLLTCTCVRCVCDECGSMNIYFLVARLFEAVCPWADIAYEEQLKKKEEDIRGALKKMTSGLSKEIGFSAASSDSVSWWCVCMCVVCCA